MKKILFLVFGLSISFVQAQFNQDAPWMKDLNIEERRGSNPVTFQEIVDAFDAYWETRDPNVKGSGFKPFMRWKNYWENFVKEDGTLPTSAELWATWESQKDTQLRTRRVDESNWIPLGPFTHTNTGSWSSGQGRVNAIMVDPNNPNTYYVGAPAGGLWKSTDSGATWTTTTDNLPQIGVSGIAVDHSNSDIIYIATGDDDASDSFSVGVMKSTDGGDTWTTTDLNPGNTPSSMNDIYMHPTNSNILWVATNNGVYKTTDGGNDWRNRNVGGSSNGTTGLNIRDIKINPINPDIIYAVSSSNFFKSTDGGENFDIILGHGLPASSSRIVIDVTPDNPNVVYLLSAGGSSSFQGLYKSTNQGEDFTLVANQGSVGDIFESTQAWYDMAMSVSDTNEDEVYVGVLNIWRTMNSGQTFQKLNYWNAPFSDAYTHADIHFLRFYNGELYAGTDGGFYKSADSGVNFTDLTAGMQIGQFYKIAVSKQTSSKMVGGLQDNGGHAYNNNLWQNYYGADGMDTAIDPNNSDIYYGFVQFGGSLNISSTSGASLNGQVGGPSGEQGNWVTPLAMSKNSELYAGFSSLYKLTGSNWSAISTSFGTNIDRLEIDEIDPNNIYVATNATLRKSTNSGITFTSIETFPSNITSIEVNNTDNSIVYVTTASNVYKSIDGGLNFTNISSGLPGVTKNCIKHQGLNSLNPLFLATSLGVYRYDDSTLTWELFNNNLPNVTVTDLEINVFDNIITASTYGRGIWQSGIPILLANNDVKLVEVTGINSTIDCETNVAAQVVVENNGLNPINTVAVTYYIDGVSSGFDWFGNISSGESATIDIPSFSLGSGVHSFSVNTTIVNDAYIVNNDSATFNIYANETGTPNNVNTFENNEDDMLVIDEGTSTQYWQRGLPTGTVLNTTESGTKVYGTNLSGNHGDGIKSYLVSPCYDLSNLTSPELSFFMAFQLERDWDIVYVEYSIDSGDTWNILGSSNDPNWYNSNTTAGENNTCFNCPGAQWTGTNPFMTEYIHDLSAFSSETNIQFRIVFHSDAAVNFEGAIVDDFVVRGTLSTGEFNDSSFVIYPNPSNGIFNIKTVTSELFDLNVYDISGKQILSNRKLSSGSDSYQLDLRSFASGVYFLEINTSNTTTTKKLILTN
ncbi:glycosyl hydrolase [Hanstruepera neustonica]|uniref:Glycosyl hydrolase n=1 Tax=Hanstruepera neustonica TaxID=1445657 RepID=A0A2K1E2W1_9FLAO|nr:T9SS type A sorting domain-containing protein [Hanstruepera neustonica]PNQ74628.1 glycosyl hydrolase [Hanstruepera neustonica]